MKDGWFLYFFPQTNPLNFYEFFKTSVYGDKPQPVWGNFSTEVDENHLGSSKWRIIHLEFTTLVNFNGFFGKS